jgi:hypothetical protein
LGELIYDEQMAAALFGRLHALPAIFLFQGENDRLRESSINDLYRPITVPKGARLIRLSQAFVLLKT